MSSNYLNTIVPKCTDSWWCWRIWIRSWTRPLLKKSACVLFCAGQGSCGSQLEKMHTGEVTRQLGSPCMTISSMTASPHVSSPPNVADDSSKPCNQRPFMTTVIASHSCSLPPLAVAPGDGQGNLFLQWYLLCCTKCQLCCYGTTFEESAFEIIALCGISIFLLSSWDKLCFWFSC